MTEQTTTDLPRTADEIVSRIHEINDAQEDVFGVERSRILDALPFARAMEFMRNPKGDEEEWEKGRIKSVQDVRLAMESYMKTAWRGANRKNGLTARKSIAHFRGLVWLLGNAGEALFEKLTEEEGVNYFGKLQFVAVAEFFNWNGWRKIDDGEWVLEYGDKPLTADAAMASQN